MVLALTLCAVLAMIASFMWLALPSRDLCGVRTMMTRLYHDIVPYRRGTTLSSEDYEVLRAALQDLLGHVKRDDPPGKAPSTRLPLLWPLWEDGSDIGGEIVVDAHVRASRDRDVLNLRTCYWVGCTGGDDGDLVRRLAQYDAMEGLLLDADAVTSPRVKVRDLSAIRSGESWDHWDALHARDPQALVYVAVSPPAFAADGLHAAVVGRILLQPHGAHFQVTLLRRCGTWQVVLRDFEYTL